MANMRLVKLKNRPSKGVFVFEYMQEQIERLRGQGKERTVETYQSALNSFMKFRDGIDLCFDEMDADLMEHYETEMRSTHHLSRNTTSFYMRILRCVYRKAVGEGLALPADPFENVYTGVDKTSKRAATLTDIKHIKQLDLSDHKSLEFARDIFLFSFYMRGMSFIDLAYLRKKDLNSGFVSYSRRKTGKKLIIRWEKQMQEIIDRYGDSETQYLLPIIEREDGTERRQYRNKMLLVNRKLKKIAARVVHGISMGAATTMMVSGEPQPDYVKCFVEDCGYTSVWDQFSKELKEQFGLPQFPLMYTADWLCQLEYGWGFKEASALKQVARCHLPMFFIHGDKDDYVPTWMVYKLYEAKPQPKALWIVPEADHAHSYLFNTEEYTQKVKAFVDKYIQ